MAHLFALMAKPFYKCQQFPMLWAIGSFASAIPGFLLVYIHRDVHRSFPFEILNLEGKLALFRVNDNIII